MHTRLFTWNYFCCGLNRNGFCCSANGCCGCLMNGPGYCCAGRLSLRAMHVRPCWLYGVPGLSTCWQNPCVKCLSCFCPNGRPFRPCNHIHLHYGSYGRLCFGVHIGNHLRWIACCPFVPCGGFDLRSCCRIPGGNNPFG